MPLKSWDDLLADAGGAGGSFEPIPPGDYDFVIDKAEATMSKNGKTMYKTKCKVEGGPHANRIVWHQHVISPESSNALQWFFRNMKILGCDEAFFRTNPAEHQVAAQLEGKRFRGDVGVRTFNGQESNEIKQFYTTKSSPGAPAPTSAAPAPSPSGPPVPAPAPTPSPLAAAPAPAPAPAFAAPASAPAVAPPAPAPSAAPALPPVQQETAPAPVPDVAPPAAAPAPAPAPAPSVGVPPPPPF